MDDFFDIFDDNVDSSHNLSRPSFLSRDNDFYHDNKDDNLVSEHEDEENFQQQLTVFIMSFLSLFRLKLKPSHHLFQPAKKK